MSRTRKGSTSPKDASDDDANDIEACSICLHTFSDRTLVPICAHEFCFDCILEWTGQSRKCPLCNQAIGEYLIHRIRGRYDYQKYYITALPEKDADSRPGPSRRPRRERAHRDEADRLEQSIEKRRAVYEWHLFSKHVASNAYTKYRPYPTPAQFAASPELIRRTTMFLRRELRVWNLDVEFLTTFTISLMKSIDIRSESAVKLIAEFLDLDGGKENAEHFAHEIYTYVRSPYQDLFVYDTVVQYDDPPERDYRWRRPPSPQGQGRGRVLHGDVHLRRRVFHIVVRRQLTVEVAHGHGRHDHPQSPRGLRLGEHILVLEGAVHLVVRGTMPKENKKRRRKETWLHRGEDLRPLRLEDAVHHLNPLHRNLLLRLHLALFLPDRPGPHGALSKLCMPILEYQTVKGRRKPFLDCRCPFVRVTCNTGEFTNSTR
ncbi:hypothetical protein BDZ89DRAFT_427250 [Hymenopellis radicata]|nr:hypothetical protein BDZ89DRAFT_427250 [Hymenopellis radicata]